MVHWDTKHSKEMIALIVIGLAAVLTLAIPFAMRNRARGDPLLPIAVARVSEEAKGLVQEDDILQFTVFTSPVEDYRFEAPAVWRSPVDSHDATREAFFVGPIDKTHHLVVFLAISRYPQAGSTDPIESAIALLHRDRAKRLITNESRLVDQHPARFLTVHEQAVLPSLAPEVVSFSLIESFVIIEGEANRYILEYVASPERYEKYLPVFDRLVTSFHITQESRGSGSGRAP